jgi:transposase
MVAELQAHLRIVYTPAYDPEAKGIEWLWRRSRREVTHNHQRRSFATLQEDIRVHFQSLVQQPDRVLQQIGSPLAQEPPAACRLALAA